MNKSISEKLDDLTLKMASAILAVEDAKNKTYPVVSDRYISEGLEAAYDNIIADNPELADVSAVGFTAILRQNDNLWTNGNRMFINGEEIEGNLTGYAAEGQYEVLNVWYFAKHYDDDDTYHLSLQADSEHPFQFEISELDIRQKRGTITLSQEYYYNTPTISTDGWFDFVKSYSSIGLPPDDNAADIARHALYERSNPKWQTKRMRITGYKNDEYFDCETPDDIEYIYCDCRKMKNSGKGIFTAYVTVPNRFDLTYSPTADNPHMLSFRAKLKVADFPNLETIENGASGFSGCYNATINMPELRRIGSASWPGNYGNIAIMTAVNSCTLSSMVNYVGEKSFNGNCELVLNCTDATFHQSWYGGLYGGWTATMPSGGLHLADDWGATINLSIAAKEHTEEWFIDVMTNKLRDMTITEETRSLTIPAAILTTMQASEDGQAALGAAQAKGWTVGGA